MRGTNNSMETLLDDQTAEHQRDDERHKTSETFPSKSSNRMASEKEPSPPPTKIARCNNSFKHVHRTFWIVIQDIEATKKFHKHPTYKHRDAKASINALERLIQQYNLLHKNQAGMICQPSGEGLRKTLQSIWGPHKSRDVGSSKTIWLASKRDWNSSYLRTVENAYEELTLDESLPEYNPAHAKPFNTDAGGHGEGKVSRFGRARVSENKQSNEITSAKVQGNPTSEIEQHALDTIAVSPMTILSPLTQSPTPELQTSYRRSSLEVSPKTHLVMTEADSTCTSSGWRLPRTDIVRVNKLAPPMPRELRHPQRKLRVRNVKLPRSLHTQAATVVKSQKLPTVTNPNPSFLRLCRSKMTGHSSRKRELRYQAQRSRVSNAQSWQKGPETSH